MVKILIRICFIASAILAGPLIIQACNFIEVKISQSTILDSGDAKKNEYKGKAVDGSANDNSKKSLLP